MSDPLPRQQVGDGRLASIVARSRAYVLAQGTAAGLMVIAAPAPAIASI